MTLEELEAVMMSAVGTDDGLTIADQAEFEKRVSLRKQVRFNNLSPFERGRIGAQIEELVQREMIGEKRMRAAQVKRDLEIEAFGASLSGASLRPALPWKRAENSNASEKPAVAPVADANKAEPEVSPVAPVKISQDFDITIICGDKDVFNGGDVGRCAAHFRIGGHKSGVARHLNRFLGRPPIQSGDPIEMSKEKAIEFLRTLKPTQKQSH